MKKYIYKPIRFYVTAFTFTWLFWIAAIFFEKEIALTLMFFGLLVPAIVAITTIFRSKNNMLKNDFKKKLISFYRIKPLKLLMAIIIFIFIVVLSILISTLFGESITQLSFTEGFSFSISGFSALATILLASVIEEVGWRGYGEDSVAAYHSWFIESIIFGILWAVWHLPLFWIKGSYHFGLKELGPEYIVNFLVSVIALGFITTWVYVSNNRSMLASIIFHLLVNTMQEKIAMTPKTKCYETFVIIAIAILIVLFNKELFFEKKHIGNLLES